jgi:hypothetical protein
MALSQIDQTHVAVACDTAYRLMNEDVPAHRLAKFWRLEASEIDDWLRGRRPQDSYSQITPNQSSEMW